MITVTKVVRIQQSGSVGAVTQKYFAVAKKKRQIFKDITTQCFHAEKSGFVKETLEMYIVWS